MTETLANYKITFDNVDYVLCIKRTLASIKKQPIKEIKLEACGVLLDDNNVVGNKSPDDIFIKTVSSAEADKFIVVKVVSLGHKVPEYIQVKKTDKIYEVINILQRNRNDRLYGIFKDDSIFLAPNKTMEQCGLVDDASIYAYYGNVSAPVRNPIRKHESISVIINPELMGSDLKNEVATKLNKSADNFVLFVTNAENSKFTMIEDSQSLFKYAITEKSVIMSVEVKKLNNDIEKGEIKRQTAYSTIYEARNMLNNHKIALKEYDIGSTDTPTSEIISTSKAFRNELMNSWKLHDSGQCDRIVKMLGIYRDGLKFYFAMDLMQASLRDVMDRSEETVFTDSCIVNGTVVRHIKDNLVKKFTLQIIEGLKFLHGMNILHRNLKCASVLLDDKNNAKLCSFGFSKYLMDSSGDELIDGFRSTRAADYHFASPETLEDSKWSVYSDIWSLGATVVEMRTGSKPYDNKSEADMLLMIMDNKRLEYNRPADMDDATYKIFNGFILCCTKLEPKERYRLDNLHGHEYLQQCANI